MPKTARTILAATDFSERGDIAVHRAARLAVAQRARLEILHVIHGLGSTPWWSEALKDDADDALVRRTREQLDTLAASVAQAHGIEVTTAQRRGSIAASVATHASEIGASLLVLGATGAGAVSKRLLGSSTQAILRVSPVPVLVTRIGAELDYRRVLFATDFSPASDAAVETGLGLAPGAGCFFFTALDVPTSRIEPLLGLDDTSRAQKLQEAREITRDRLGTLAARVGHDGAGILVRDGRPSAEIPDVVREVDAELLCLGAHSKPLLERLVLGSTSAHAVAEAGCDVLVVHEQPDAT